jgi:hypothetical protein
LGQEALVEMEVLAQLQIMEKKGLTLHLFQGAQTILQLVVAVEMAACLQQI